MERSENKWNIFFEYRKNFLLPLFSVLHNFQSFWQFLIPSPKKYSFEPEHEVNQCNDVNHSMKLMMYQLLLTSWKKLSIHHCF